MTFTWHITTLSDQILALVQSESQTQLLLRDLRALSGTGRSSNGLGGEQAEEGARSLASQSPRGDDVYLQLELFCDNCDTSTESSSSP